MYRQILFILIVLSLTKMSAQSDSDRQELYNQEQQIKKELQVKYKDFISYLTKSKSKDAPTYKKTLIESQKHWEKYVVNYCTFEAMPANETPRGSDSFYRECEIDKTKERLKELNQQFDSIKSVLGD